MGMQERLIAGVIGSSARRKAFLERRSEGESSIRAAVQALNMRRQEARSIAEAPLPSTFEMLYQSDDGRFCLFQTEDGHISAVDSSRMI